MLHALDIKATKPDSMPSRNTELVEIKSKLPQCKVPGETKPEQT